MRCVLGAVLVVSVLRVTTCSAEESGKPATALETERNVYRIDPFWVEVFDQWKPVGRTTIGLLYWNDFEPNPMLDVKIEISKVGQMIHGLQRKGIGLPLPEALRFRVWLDVPDLWVVLGDKGGRRISSRLPLAGLKPRQWCPIELPLAEMVPLGVGAERIRDLDVIALLTQESAGEYDEEPARIYLSRIEAVYPKGQGPTNPTFTKEALEEMLKPLPPMIEQIDQLLADAKAKGIDTRYPTVSRTVLRRYHGEVSAMTSSRDPFVAKRTAEFLMECAKRTRQELEDMIRQPDRVIRMPQVAMENLKVREGTFFAGDRPVILTGVCGWFGPSHFEQLSPMGYTSLSIEIGPSSTVPNENETKPDAVGSIKAVMDAAARHHIVCDLLVSPHYFPDWARAKWPGTDATGWRRQTNEFMPWSVTDPHVREVIARHLSVLIPQVRDHPALVSYNLINEAWYRAMPDFPAGQWTEFRRQNPQVDEWQALARLTTHNVTEFLSEFIAELHRHDKTHPVQIKAFDTPDMLNIDRESLGEILTASGMDAMPSWPDRTGRLAAEFAWPLLRHDFHRSLQPDKPILDGEYHISGGTYPTPSSYFQAALWVLALHGRDMTNCWVFDRVDDVSIYWHANGVEVLGRTALDLLRLAPEVHAFQRQRGPLAMYYGGTTGTSDAYLACLFQDLDVGIVTDRRILAGQLADYKVLVVPSGSRMPGAVREKVDAFRKGGGHVVMCPTGAAVETLWQQVRRAVEQTKLPRWIRADRWGIECRSVTLGGRKLFYVLNHHRKPVDVAFQSDGSLTDAVDLRTQEKLDASRLHLQPLEIRLIEVR